MALQDQGTQGRLQQDAIQFNTLRHTSTTHFNNTLQQNTATTHCNRAMLTMLDRWHCKSKELKAQCILLSRIGMRMTGHILVRVFERVCCSVLQCVAVCCSMLQCGAVWCSVVQCVAVCCSVLHRHASDCPCHIRGLRAGVSQCVAVCCSVLQHVAVCVTVCCSVLQRVASSCK